MNTPISKILTVCIVMVILGVAIVPVINAFNGSPDTPGTTETITYGDNTRNGVPILVAEPMRGDIGTNTTESYKVDANVSTTTPDPNGSWVTYPSDYAYELAGGIKLNKTNYLYITYEGVPTLIDTTDFTVFPHTINIPGTQSGIPWQVYVDEYIGDNSILTVAVSNAAMTGYITVPTTYGPNGEYSNTIGSYVTGYYFSQEDDTGQYLMIPYPMTDARGFVYMATVGSNLYYYDGAKMQGNIVAASATDEMTVYISDYVTEISTGPADEDNNVMIAITGGVEGGFMVIPYEYEISYGPSPVANTMEPYYKNDRPARGYFNGTTFAKSSSGELLMIDKTNLDAYDFFIGDDRSYYIVDSLGNMIDTAITPTNTITGATVTLTSLTEPSKVYEISVTLDDDSYCLVVPYTITYDNVTPPTPGKGSIPMLDMIPLVIIIVCIVYVASSLYARRDY